ncbi:uncharacterized protein LOC113298330 isoform X2 [Papaver somniferum]|uniref:uncharacterized protein LOC113298330 isoform X2 n=1 Tax=Papaver somniferum TaxID=3469 RepID=UPI000E6FE941|nr:uncharacterized protein LOC113298330 isoform X2 [Papaver somniferum]
MAPHHPSLINHPCHSKHPLSLLSSPPYPLGIFNCDACNRQDMGFCYHCKECKVDLHVHCAALPLSVNHNSHSQHPLKLTFLIPYPTNDFSCDICKNLGSKCWEYRCDSCGFDAHLNCATTVSPTTIQRGLPVQQPQPMIQHQFSLPGHKQQTPPTLQNNNSFPRMTQPYAKPAPTGYNLATSQQYPNYYAMNNNQPTFGAPAMGVPTPGIQQTYYMQNQPGIYMQNQPGNNPSMGASMTQGFYQGVGQQAGQVLMQNMLGSFSAFGGGNVDPSTLGGGNFDPSSLGGGNFDPSSLGGGNVDPSGGANFEWDHNALI